MITFFLKFKKNILLSIIILSLTILVMTLTFLFTNDEELNESSINKNLNQQEDIEKSISEESKIIKKTEKSAEKILPKNQSKLNDPVTKTKV